MILKEFSNYLKNFNDEITQNKTSAVKVLCEWIRYIVNKNPKNNIDKIIHKEIMLAQNKAGDFLILGKSKSGRVLVNALYNFALSYENFLMSRWLENKKPKDFNRE